jgi:hypothetical protein
MADGAIAKHQRRWLRTSVRGLILFVLMIAALLGWFVRCVKTQRDAVGAITKADGGVQYSYQWDPRRGHYDRRRQPRCPKWLLDLVGIDCVYSVESVSVRVESNDTVLSAVGKLTRLRELGLYAYRGEAEGVADNGMINVGRLTALESLSIYNVPVTDSGLAHLKGLSHLKKLDLTGTNITNSGLMHLRHLSSLEHLNLTKTQVSDQSIAALRGMGALKHLDLSFTLFSFPASVELSHAISGARIYNWPLRWGPGLPDDGSGHPFR